VEPPSPVDREMRVLDVEGATALIAAAQGTGMYLPLVLALSTGCRRGELAALRWEDIHLDRGELTVARSLETTKGTLTFREQKTKRSRRKVNLPAFAVEALLRHKAAQAEERLALGEHYHYHGRSLAPGQPDDGVPPAGEEGGRGRVPPPR